MVEQKNLAVTLRTTMGKANKHLRREGLIPGNISGHKQESQPIQIAAEAFEKLCRNHDTSGLLQLMVSDAPMQTVLIRHVQRAPTSGKVIHIDFSRVNMHERITTKVALRYIGESDAIKTRGGVLLHLMETLEVGCSASAIVDYLEVDISSLAKIDMILHAGDVELPDNYILITPAEESIAKIASTRAEGTKASEATAASATK